MINRAVLMVIPKRPFFEWEKSVFPDLPSIEEGLDDYNAYLLKDNILPDELKSGLKNQWQWIFENELRGICEDEATWPKNRSWKLFNEWFELKFSSIVLDLVNGPIRKENIE